MEQRTYALESSHLYSVMDLRQVSRRVHCVTVPVTWKHVNTGLFPQIADDEYVGYLITLLQHATNHVFHCDLCSQRGFICQICHADDIIFPFQLDITTRYVVPRPPRVYK